MIKAILENELKDTLGHAPTSAEFKSAMAWLADYLTDQSLMVDVELALIDWRDEICEKCENCDGYFLPDELDERAPYWSQMYPVKVCSEECFNNYCEWHCPEKPEISSHI